MTSKSWRRCSRRATNARVSVPVKYERMRSWRRLALPGIFPFYITGAITAAGGAWNASIVAEWVSWGNTTLKATGLGEYIHASTTNGNCAQIALGTVMMSI